MSRPFDLDAAVRGEPVVTRDGEKVTELYYFKTTNETRKLCAVIEGNIVWFDDVGKINGAQEFGYDLFMASKTKTYYMNVYKSVCHGNYFICSYLHKSDFEAKALANSDKEYIKTISFEIEE